jgi:hypothetical protein
MPLVNSWSRCIRCASSPACSGSMIEVFRRGLMLSLGASAGSLRSRYAFPFPERLARSTISLAGRQDTSGPHLLQVLHCACQVTKDSCSERSLRLFLHHLWHERCRCSAEQRVVCLVAQVEPGAASGRNERRCPSDTPFRLPKELDERNGLDGPHAVPCGMWP